MRCGEVCRKDESESAGEGDLDGGERDDVGVDGAVGLGDGEHGG